LRRGIFPSVEALVAAIEEYLCQHNQSPKPFIWTAKANGWKGFLDALFLPSSCQKSRCQPHLERKDYECRFF
jgi:hypothetical protein